MTEKTVQAAVKQNLDRGVSVRAINALMATVTLVISAVLLITTYQTNRAYTLMRVHTDNYIRWQRSASELQSGSDYLTEQVRCFVVTGEREFLDNYFEEAKVTHRRDLAVAAMAEYDGTRRVYSMMQDAMDESVKLMEREYYVMRLRIEADGGALEDYPEEIQRVDIKPEDEALTPQGKEALARSMVFDQVYHEKKQAISELTQSCLGELTEELEGQQASSADELHSLLGRQKALIIVLIAVTLSTIILTVLLVISPLLRAVVFIRAEQPIPIRGSYEFRFLARTYNLMYEASREQREKLLFEAMHDKLTGVYNRSGYDFLMKNTELTTAALLLFDVDKFKPINDTRGHEMGDHVLQAVAQSLRRAFRADDYICRIGGDEFVVIMLHVNESATEQIFRKVARINDELRRGDEELPPVTVSCGAAFGCKLEEGENLFTKADAALYSVKRAGGGGCKL